MTYLDTSALVRAWRMQITPQGFTRAHSVAEFYATLTRGLTVTVGTIKTRVIFTPAETSVGAKEVFSKMTFRDLNGKQALTELEFAAKDNVQSANIHDWMHAAVAKETGCEAIVTTNPKHFKLVTKLRLVDPADFFAKT
jgi:predicted nucleic acid-binding protein